MKRKITISYEWKKEDGSEVQDNHREYLEESAMEHITTMMEQGYVQGQLSDNLHAACDPAHEDGTQYSGWWSSVTE